MFFFFFHLFWVNYFLCKGFRFFFFAVSVRQTVGCFSREAECFIGSRPFLLSTICSVPSCMKKLFSFVEDFFFYSLWLHSVRNGLLKLNVQVSLSVFSFWSLPHLSERTDTSIVYLHTSSAMWYWSRSMFHPQLQISDSLSDDSSSFTCFSFCFLYVTFMCLWRKSLQTINLWFELLNSRGRCTQGSPRGGLYLDSSVLK